MGIGDICDILRRYGIDPAQDVIEFDMLAKIARLAYNQGSADGFEAGRKEGYREGWYDGGGAD